jgi:hypothetical protein
MIWIKQVGIGLRPSNQRRSIIRGHRFFVMGHVGPRGDLAQVADSLGTGHCALSCRAIAGRTMAAVSGITPSLVACTRNVWHHPRRKLLYLRVSLLSRAHGMCSNLLKGEVPRLRRGCCNPSDRNPAQLLSGGVAATSPIRRGCCQGGLQQPPL